MSNANQATQYMPKPSTDAEGKPKYDTKSFLDETVRMSDRNTRRLHFAIMEGKASPKLFDEITEQYRHIANRVAWVRDDLAERARDNGSSNEA